MQGDRGIYVHCDVSKRKTNFCASARSQYASDVCVALKRASSTVSQLLSRD